MYRAKLFFRLAVGAGTHSCICAVPPGPRQDAWIRQTLISRRGHCRLTAGHYHVELDLESVRRGPVFSSQRFQHAVFGHFDFVAHDLFGAVGVAFTDGLR